MASSLVPIVVINGPDSPAASTDVPSAGCRTGIRCSCTHARTIMACTAGMHIKQALAGAQGAPYINTVKPLVLLYADAGANCAAPCR